MLMWSKIISLVIIIFINILQFNFNFEWLLECSNLQCGSNNPKTIVDFFYSSLDLTKFICLWFWDDCT